MKIGILTFHSQLNYGGVLQCWALQTALERLGHEAVVMDRWQNADNSSLERGYNKWGWWQWLRFWVRGLLGLGDLSLWLRVRRTKRFLGKYLHLTWYHFVEWMNAPKELGVYMLVVGSDQVWHCGDWGDPRAYLLEGTPQIPAIAYAASFGMTELPGCLGPGAADAEDLAAEPIYRRGLSKFKAISCRECEGVEICKWLGFDAVHVVDPTLLAWGEGAADNSKAERRRVLVCYFLSERIEDHISELDGFARRNHCKVKVLLNGAWLSPFPTNLSRMKSLLRRWKLRMNSCVEIMDSAGPEEFYDAFKNVRWVVSDSFHALMFSICNGCDARMVRPSIELRRQMFARIEEFAEHTKGPLIVNSVSDALTSFAENESVSYDYEWLECRRHESEEWLKKVLPASNDGRLATND